jgi:hypothetical protein
LTRYKDLLEKAERYVQSAQLLTSDGDFDSADATDFIIAARQHLNRP